MTSLVFVMLSPYDQVWSLLAFALLLVLYAVAYRAGRAAAQPSGSAHPEKAVRDEPKAILKSTRCGVDTCLVVRTRGATIEGKSPEDIIRPRD